MLNSGNDAATAIAIAVGGSVENFKNRLKSVENYVESVDNFTLKRWYIKVFHHFNIDNA